MAHQRRSGSGQYVPDPDEVDRLRGLDAAEALAPVDPENWWRPPADTGLTSAYWDDPEPRFQGMLSSDRIAAYHYAVGRMIRPFQEQRLKPASYELTLGPVYLIKGERKTLDRAERSTRDLVIPPNSIVFVSMREQLLLPYWLAGRFDLAIDYIYQGLLLGTGPQVDPGFQGVLGCPLHNISNRPITLSLGEPFAKIDFVKTSFGFGEGVTLPDVGSNEELRAESDLSGYQGHPLKLFALDKTWRVPIFFLTVADVRLVESSVSKLQDEVVENTELVETTLRFVERTRTFSIVGAVGVIALVATLFAAFVAAFAYTLTYTDGRVGDQAKLSQSVTYLTREVSALKLQDSALCDSVVRLEPGRSAPAGCP